MSIGKVVRSNRERLGWTQEELAKKLGVSISTVGMIETDKRNVKDSIKYQLCSLFNISISELMNENTDNLEILKNKVIAILLQSEVTKKKFTSIIKEVLEIIESEENHIINYSKEARKIIHTILTFFMPKGYIYRSLNEEQYKFVKENKEEILNMINSIKYQELEFENYLNVYPEINGIKVESSIIKNPFEEKNKYFAIKIESDKMIPKYERGNIVIIQKSEIFTNGQDVCFKEKSHYEIGRVYIDNDIVIIKFLKCDCEVKTFNIEDFKKFFVGTVFATRYSN